MKTTIDIWRIKMTREYEQWLIAQWLLNHRPSVEIDPSEPMPHPVPTMRTKTSDE